MHPNRPPSSSGHGPDPPAPHSHRHFSSGRSSFAHHLPPPIPSQPSPSLRYFNPASPNYRDGLGPTDPVSWASDRPTSNRSSNRWSPTLPALALSPRTHTQTDMTGDRDRERDRERQIQRSFSLSQHHPSQHRLPPLDFPQRPGSGWGDPPSTGHSSTSRPPTAYEPYRPGSSSFPHAHALAPFPPPPPHYQPYSSVQPIHQSNPYFQRERDLVRERERRMAPAPAATAEDADSPDLRGESPSGETGKKKKRRIALSCAECAKRKQKCNRETPCQHCVSRRVPELCVPYTRNNSPQPQQQLKAVEKKVERERQLTGGSQLSVGQLDQVQGQVTKTPGMLPTLSVRVGRLEAMVNAMINRVGGLEGKALHDWRINHAPATTPPPGAPLLLQVSPDTRPDTGETVVAREGSAGQEAGLMTGIDEESSTRNPLPQSMLETTDPVPLGLDYHGTPAEQLQRLFTDCGVSPHKIQDLIAELPPRSDANDLIDWFFRKINHVRYPISEFLFRQSFVLIYENKTISGAAVLALPLVFIVLAMAIRVAPDEWVGGEEEKRTNSLRMYWNARMAINMASAVKAENLQLVETRICTGLYLVLMHERRLAEGWAEFRAALTTGQAIGLHRDGKKLGLDPYMTEYRRRIWSYLVHADGTYSCLLGRPISIDPKSCDTLPPSNIDIEVYQPPTSHPLPAPKPMDQPSYGTYLIVRRHLGEIVARVTQHFQRLDGGGGYKDVEDLNNEFQGLREGLPGFFKMEGTDRSWDEKCWYLPVHRYYIQTEILHFTIILHRPWLLRKLKSSRYRLSRQACFEAAVTDYKIRQAWKQECPDFFETLLGGSFREFNVAMIAGISMIVDPRGLHAADMRQIVQSFMQENPHDPRADDFTTKEAAIIHTLYRRAQEMEDRRIAHTAHVRPSISNERGQPRASAGTSASSFIGSQDDSPMLDESGEGRRRMPAPALPGRSSGDQHATPGKSPLGNFMMGQMANMTPASSGSEDDNPQRLLNQWLISNTYFGPGSDNTMSAFNTSYPTMMPYQFDPPDPSLGYQPLQAQLGGTSLGAANAGGLYQAVDPDLTPTTGLQGLGIDTTGIDTVGGIYTAQGNDPTGEIPSLVGPPGEDGNPTVFWERLIDGIVVGQGYDLSGTRVQS